VHQKSDLPRVHGHHNRKSEHKSTGKVSKMTTKPQTSREVKN